MTKPIRRSNAPDPEKYALSGSEDAHQISLFMWASQNYERYPELSLMYAIPNGGFRHKAEAGKFRAMGVKRGVPDICLPIARGSYHGLYIELKRPKSEKGRAGTTNEDQNSWIAKLREQGYGAAKCVGWEAARDMLIQYLNFKV